MRRRIVAKGNVRRKDFLRAILTDTLPEEVPIIFSNDGFYANISNNKGGSPEFLSFVEALLKPSRPYTKPYRYNVLKDASSARGLSLIHPSAQKKVAEFYGEYDSLIAYYAARSPASLRAPVKVGSTFFVKERVSDKNQYRSGGIDTVTLESSVSNPASYFSYNKISRAHEFFSSNDYVHLEKKYKTFRSLDVSKCFSSIYTHTFYWAIDDVETAKENTSAKNFPNLFDKLMQSMNYNETNGICVGPEVSRIFAEIILAEVDRRAISILKSRGLNFRSDFEFRRYVDDFYVFSHDEAVSDKVTAAIQTCLSFFNMYLNEGKVHTMSRPFVTQKSRLVASTSVALTAFFEKIIKYEDIDDELIAVPRIVRRSDALIKSFIGEVKSVCANHQVGYETSSDYIISALCRRIIELSDSYPTFEKAGFNDPDRWLSTLHILLELTYFFYTVNPTVRSSLNVAKSVIVATRLVKERMRDRYPFISESIVRWTLDLSKSVQRSNRHSDLTAIPIEVLNVIIPMYELASDEPLVERLIETLCTDESHFGYFEVTSFLFLFGRRRGQEDSVLRLFARGKKLVEESSGPRVDSQAAHLCLDLLVCPYIPIEKRASWFNVLRGQCGLGTLSQSDARAALTSTDGYHWFTRWDRVDLLRLLRKKELSAIY